ncbi:hypothetical protein CDD80_1115 [Ophiocordyceps camponoti-rufipedis]|uniref:Uncharacterized protein n=1 Tax=Ophiocordyceps camponoti-rufipedis TaxID=2004952 RepID=A0A2C5Z7A7_9HYPO|nr:hypothetical protein CDD80_1115 [Ophiocordyceps camponoti-rufipedis]
MTHFVGGGGVGRDEGKTCAAAMVAAASIEAVTAAAGTISNKEWVESCDETRERREGQHLCARLRRAPEHFDHRVDGSYQRAGLEIELEGQ